MKQKDLTGLRFTRWLVLSKSDDIQRKDYKESVWFCKCDCGVERKVRARLLLHIRSGSKSCGCLQRETAALTIAGTNITHGHASSNENLRHRLYATWKSMRQRCNNSNSPKYKRYGGRGIYVCSRWDKFVNFLADMGKKWQAGLSLDRINNNGPYSPDNCRWTTYKEQAFNRGNQKLYVIESLGYTEEQLLNWETLDKMVEHLKTMFPDISGLEFYGMLEIKSAIFYNNIEVC